MKKLFLISVVIAGLFTSCVQNEQIVPEQKESDAGIKFQTVVAKQGTRAIITGQEYNDDAPSFGTFAFHNPNGTLPGTVVHVPLTEIIHHEGTTHYWAPENASQYTWPPAGSLCFFSYSPYYYQETEHKDTKLVVKQNPEIGQRGFVFENYDVSAHQQTDLMVADVKYGLTANVTNGNHTGVPTVFRHKLAMIGGFILATSEDYDGEWDGVSLNTATKGDMRFLIKNIKFKKVPVVGTFQSAGVKGDGTAIDEVWTMSTAHNPVEVYEWFNSATGIEFGHVEKKQLHIYDSEENNTLHKYESPTIENGYLLAIPQVFGNQSETSLEITYIIETFDETQNNWVATKRVENGVEKTDIVKDIKLSAIHASTVDNQTVYGGWEANKKIVYTLEFSTEEIRWAPTVVEWEAKDIKIDY